MKKEAFLAELDRLFDEFQYYSQELSEALRLFIIQLKEFVLKALSLTKDKELDELSEDLLRALIHFTNTSKKRTSLSTELFQPKLWTK